MTLNMPQLLNTFPTSAAAGEGFESQYVEKFFLEATGIVPIGSIVSWCKSFPGVPALGADTLFVECNGQVLNDPSSPLDGQTIPNYNGENRFARGNSTSGGTGGTATIGTHTHGLNTNVQTHVDQTAKRGSSTTVTDSGGGHDNQPPYFDVVWIMRVK